MDSHNIDHDPLKYEEVIEFRKLLGNESDRGCALAAAAYLDEQLEALFRGYLVDDKARVNNLMESNGPLGTFSGRIDLAYLLGLIPKKAANDLHLIRKIRNEFAHISGSLTFDSPAIASRCKELKHDLYYEALTPRKNFMRVATGVAAYIHVAMSVEPRRIAKHDIDFNTPFVQKLVKKFREIGHATVVHFDNSSAAVDEMKGDAEYESID